MRRAILTIGGTAAGLAALLSFKTHTVADAAAGTPTATTPTSAATSPSGSAAGSATKSTKSAKSGGGKAAAGTRTVTGKVDPTQYGPMQVQLVLAGKKITAVNVLQHTNTGVTSIQIDNMALPKLTSEVLTAQSARIDAVSGATYTSAGYIASLQNAVDAAGIA
jgi:uncharacterized protein with FMN-binding domain